MQDDHPMRLLSLQQAVSLAAELEVQFLDKVQGGRPILAMLSIAKREAAEALADLVMEEDIREIRKLQATARRFNDLCRWLRQIKIDGDDAEKEITREDRDMIIEALSREGPEGQRQLIEMGLVEGEDE